MQCTAVEFGTMLTLTYPKMYPKSGSLVKADINVMAQKIRRKGWSYVWFLEFQTRGAPHVHFLLSPSVITPQMRVEFGFSWAERIVTSPWFGEVCPPERHTSEAIKIIKVALHDLTFTLLRLEDGAKRYASKYAAKERQKKVPAAFMDVGRFWGSSQDVAPDGLEFDVTEDDVEQWLVDNDHPASAYELVPRYVWALGQPPPASREGTGNFQQQALPAT